MAESNRVAITDGFALRCTPGYMSDVEAQLDKTFHDAGVAPMTNRERDVSRLAVEATIRLWLEDDKTIELENEAIISRIEGGE
jgi:hypothetical protein